ncbi:MAG: hypothetical protein QM758_05895 [Armatimonas sp.]
MTVSELTAEQERLSEELLDGNVPCNPEERLELLEQRRIKPDNPTALKLSEVEDWLARKVTAEHE